MFLLCYSESYNYNNINRKGRENMKLNKRLRRINRGIALAVALLLALTGYIIYDTVNFGPQKQEIQTLLTD